MLSEKSFSAIFLSFLPLYFRRYILFARQVKAECEKKSVPCIVNDGLTGVEKMFETVKDLFDL